MARKQRPRPAIGSFTVERDSDLAFLHAAERLAAEHAAASAQMQPIVNLVRAWFENGSDGNRNRKEIAYAVYIELNALSRVIEDAEEARMMLHDFLPDDYQDSSE